MLFSLLLTALAQEPPTDATASTDPAPLLDDAPQVDDAPPTREELLEMLKAQGVADADAPAIADQILARIALDQSLQYQQGDIKIAKNKATLHVPEGYRYLSPADCDRVLVAWGNPPGGGDEGMIVPADLSPLAPEGWGVIVSYEEDGHIEDDDARDIDYAELLEQMQEDTEAANPARKKAGYGAIHLNGWAESPHYDGQNHKLYWAKLLSDDDGAVSLNYDIRVLGRKGVLAMSAIADAKDLDLIKADMEQIITFAEFNEGHRYIDFDPDVDKVAAYGLGALVAGSLAAKTGLFKGLLAVLLAGKKFVVVALAGLAAWLKNLFGGGKTQRDDE